MLNCKSTNYKNLEGTYVHLNVQWAQCFLSHMNFCSEERTTADFKKKKRTFLNDVVTIIQMRDISAELISWDQTGIKLVPSLTGP